MSQSDEKKDYKKVEKKPVKRVLEIVVDSSNVYLDGKMIHARKPTYTQGGDVFIPLSTLSKLFPNCLKGGKIKLEVTNG
jgi:hypothetical protein